MTRNDFRTDGASVDAALQLGPADEALKLDLGKNGCMGLKPIKPGDADLTKLEALYGSGESVVHVADQALLTVHEPEQ
jgi:hypothetical protein